jgi:hypothetical protein
MLVLVVYLCPSSVRVVATFCGIVLFPLLYCYFLPYSLTMLILIKFNVLRFIYYFFKRGLPNFGLDLHSSGL